MFAYDLESCCWKDDTNSLLHGVHLVDTSLTLTAMVPGNDVPTGQGPVQWRLEEVEDELPNTMVIENWIHYFLLVPTHTHTVLLNLVL